MQIKINGKNEVFENERVNLLDYLVQNGIQPETVAVEVNLKIIDKRAYSETLVQGGDEIEIVRFVGGGAW